MQGATHREKMSLSSRSGQVATCWDMESVEKWPIKPSLIPHNKGSARICRHDEADHNGGKCICEQKGHKKTKTKWEVCQEMEAQRSQKNKHPGLLNPKDITKKLTLVFNPAPRFNSQNLRHREKSIRYLLFPGWSQSYSHQTVEWFQYPDSEEKGREQEMWTRWHSGGHFVSGLSAAGKLI